MGIDKLEELIKPASLREQVESYLREAIVSGQFKPGERLIERELCEYMKVSRRSLREAMRALEAEKLIVNVPHRGPIVASVTLKEARALYALRALLEGFAAHEFTRLADHQTVLSLGTAVAKLRAEAESGDQQRLLKAKANFYDILLGHCNNDLVTDILHSMLLRISLLRARSLSRPERLPTSLIEIERLYAAISARDPTLAKEIAYEHIRNAESSALDALNSEEFSTSNETGDANEQGTI
jgi:DNA-binding GntR family transcriptional regulator